LSSEKTKPHSSWVCINPTNPINAPKQKGAVHTVKVEGDEEPSSVLSALQQAVVEDYNGKMELTEGILIENRCEVSKNEDGAPGM
jgi:hypothetical protein